MVFDVDADSVTVALLVYQTTTRTNHFIGLLAAKAFVCAVEDPMLELGKKFFVVLD